MIVIADDITGAAEIAGIAFANGQQTRLIFDHHVSSSDMGDEAVVVIASDTRSMSEAEAAAETRQIVDAIGPVILRDHGPLFKKTDSALRGHVVAELTALLEHSGYRRAVYMPANPSRGRIIHHGTYYIVEGEEHRVPIHETDFSFDPEFPAHTSVLSERFPDAVCHDIIMPDATTQEDLLRIVRQYDDGHTLFAGAADLFSVVSGYVNPTRNKPITQPLIPDSLIVLCGSTQSRPLNLGIPTFEMPDDVYDGRVKAENWYKKLLEQYINDERHALILTIPRQPNSHQSHNKSTALRLRSIMAEAAHCLIRHHNPHNLVIEGGATAWSTLQALGWTQFRIVGEVAPGVVQMLADGGTIVTLKPGSYPWGGLF